MVEEEKEKRSTNAWRHTKGYYVAHPCMSRVHRLETCRCLISWTLQQNQALTHCPRAEQLSLIRDDRACVRAKLACVGGDPAALD
jgi:hypothetical protein